MTTEQKAKAYDEALKDIKVVYPDLKGDVKFVIEQAFPELKESEDEKIKKTAIKILKGVANRVFEYEGVSKESVLAYLEKQKKTGIQWLKSDNVKNPDKPYIDKAGMFYTTDGRMCHVSEIEKPKEQNRQDEKRADFTIYHPLKNGEGKYECIPYSFRGSLTSFSEDKDLIDFLHTCFYTEEECNEWIEQQKNPENVSATTMIPSCWTEKQKKQEPVEWNNTDMKEARDNLISVCRDWEYGKQTTLLPIVAMHARYFLEHLTEPKPAEWSEEDENKLHQVMEFLLADKTIALRENPHCKALHRAYDELLDWLKSLRPQPHWKPSEEQMEALMLAIEGKWDAIKPTGYMSRRLEDLYEGLANTFGVECNLEK